MATHPILDQQQLLPERGQLLSALESSLDSAKRSGEVVAVVVIKLERMRDVFIEYGYAETEYVIREFVTRLQNCLRDQDLLVRINNNEFVLLLPALKTQAQPLMAISKIQRTCGQAIEVNGFEVKLKLTFGLAIGPDDANEPSALLRCADVALRDAQHSDLESMRYCASHAGDQTNSLKLEIDLESAINEGSLAAFYQPIVDIETGELTGAEMLSRWPDGQGQVITPSEFIAVAENSGLIKPLTLWSLNNGLRECAEWQTALPNLPVSINIAATTLVDPHLPELVNSALKLWSADLGRLTIEVTESAIMSNPKLTLDTLNKLHTLGVKVAIDDFGTGYSSLAYLKELPVDVLKIDQSFVTNMAENLADRRIVQTVIDLAHNFDLTVVAEGVEDEETLDTLTLMGCQRAQGFHVGKPMPSNDLSDWFLQSPWDLMSTEPAPLA